MSVHSFCSAPDEPYTMHIARCIESFEILLPKFYVPVSRVLGLNRNNRDKKVLKKELLKMVKYHDLGKLTRKWQENLGTGRKLPLHAPLGACYLWHNSPEELRGPLSFAVAIHHTDRGLLGDNIECPDVLAVVDGVVKDNGYIDWADGLESLGNYVPSDIGKMNVIKLKEMARGLRLWARGCSILEQHRRRICASMVHHLLKLCDISAAGKRSTGEKKDEKDLYGGWLMVSNIVRFVDNLGARDRQAALVNELRRYVKILVSDYNPEKIILFGSLASEKVNPNSDIDLVVVMETDKSFLDRTKEIIERLQPRVGADFLVYTPDEFRQMPERVFFRKEIMGKGKIIYDRGMQKVG